MTSPEHYPELRGFTERLLEGLTDVVVAERAEPGRAAAPPRARRRWPFGHAFQRAAVVAAVVAVGFAGLRLVGDGRSTPDQVQRIQAGGGAVAGPDLARVRSLEDVALVALRQPANASAAGPVTSTLREEIQFGRFTIPADDRGWGHDGGASFTFDSERRVTTVRRADGSAQWRYGDPKVRFPSDRDRRLYERWAARNTGQPVKPVSMWPVAFTFDLPASPDGAREFAREHDPNRKLGVFQASSGEMAGGLAPADLPTDPDELYRTILRAIEPFAAASGAERDLIGKVGTRRELLVSVVEELLTDDRVAPAQRAAAFRMLDRVAGVAVVPDATDLLGRAGIGIRWDDTRNGPSSPTLWVFDRAASRLLGTSSALKRSAGGQSRYGVAVLRDETTR
jgi:hypothetical protein